MNAFVSNLPRAVGVASQPFYDAAEKGSCPSKILDGGQNWPLGTGPTIAAKIRGLIHRP